MQVVKDDVRRLSDEEIDKFHGELQTFPYDARMFVYDLGKIFLEQDVHDRIRNNESSIQDIKNRFSRHGLDEAKIEHVLRYFNLPNLPQEQVDGEK